MTRKLSNTGGFLLTALGAALLAYVGISWVQARNHTSAVQGVSTWSSSQQARGREIASRLAVSSVAVATRAGAPPAPGSEVATRIVIPGIGIDAPVVETPPIDGVWQVADWAVGHLATTPNPGGVGNNALSAHDDIKGEIFKRIGSLKPGDDVELYTRRAVYTYTVTSERAVDPSDVSVLAPTAKPTVTLISCTPYWVDTERVVVQGILKSRRVIR